MLDMARIDFTGITTTTRNAKHRYRGVLRVIKHTKEEKERVKFKKKSRKQRKPKKFQKQILLQTVMDRKKRNRQKRTETTRNYRK